MSYRMVDTDSLVLLIKDSTRREYNRQLDLDLVLEQVDPDGIHIVQDFLLHEHRHGEVCEPHLRCRVLIKVNDTFVPIEGWLDIEIEQFSSLPLVPEREVEMAACVVTKKDTEKDTEKDTNDS